MTTITISNLKCNGCVANAKKALQGLSGMDNVEIDLEHTKAELTGDFSLDDALQRLSDAGYPAEKAE